MAVPKKDHSIRICADFKATVNSAFEVDKYPQPRTEYLLSQVGKGKYFSKLDLKDAYLQLLIEENFRECLTITHIKDCSDITDCLSERLHFPPFYKEPCKSVIKCLPGMITSVHDLIIFLSSLMDHLNRFEAVFLRLQSVGLKLWKVK